MFHTQGNTSQRLTDRSISVDQGTQSPPRFSLINPSQINQSQTPLSDDRLKELYPDPVKQEMARWERGENNSPPVSVGTARAG